MKVHILAIEYPGYGLYKFSQPDEVKMKEDAVIVYDYLTTVVGIKEENILLCGRSMGSGPSTYVASVRNPFGLILMSPYKSIQEAAKSILGWASILGNMVTDKFRNIDVMPKVQCPVLIIHGKADKLIPVQHAIDLYNACRQPCYLFTPFNMNHNNFELQDDLIRPIRAFIRNINELKMNTNIRRKYD